MTTLGEATIRIKLDTSEATSALGKTDAKVRRTAQAQDREKRHEEGAKRVEVKQKAAVEAGLLKRGGAAVLHRARQALGIATAGSGLIQMAASFFSGLPDIPGPKGVKIPAGRAIGAALRGADVVERYGPQSVGLASGIMKATAGLVPGGKLMMSLPEFQIALEGIQALTMKMATEMTLFKAKLDAVVGAGDDTIRLAKSGAILRAGAIDPGALKDIYLELFGVHAALQGLAAHEKIISRGLMTKSVIDSMEAAIK